MGVQARIVLYAPGEDVAKRASDDAFARIAALDQCMSDYKSDSELMRLCDRAGGPPVRVSEDLYRVLDASERLARLSDGAFDPTIGPVVKLWRKARHEGVLPTKEAIASTLKLVGWRKVVLDPKRRTVRLLVPGMRLDLGGIAKGYADDCAQQVLRRHGITSALVEAGGDIVVTDAPPDRAGWVIEIVNVAPGGKTRMETLHNCAISTSGDTEQFIVMNGVRYSHIVDPRTGVGLTDRIEVTITAPNGLTSDGLSTAVSVLGAEKGPALARLYPGSTAFIRKAGN